MSCDTPKGRTHYESGKYYAIVELSNGHEIYYGPYTNRYSAYRKSVIGNKAQRHNSFVQSELNKLYSWR